MSNPNPNTDNLIKNSERTPKERKEIARKAGIKSGEVRREKALMSVEYGKALANAHNLAGKGKKLHVVVEELLLQGNVQMMKEVREATEGSKSILMNPDGSGMFKKGIKISFESPKGDSKND